VFLALVSTLEPIKHQLHIEMAQKLTSTDDLMKENITKLVHSKVMSKVNNCFLFHKGVGSWIYVGKSVIIHSVAINFISIQIENLH
jgi:hypothetical protein